MVQWQRIYLPVQETQETRVRSLSLEDLLEEEMAPHSSILPVKYYGERSLAGYIPWSCKESDMTEHIQNINKNKMIIYFNNTK